MLLCQRVMLSAPTVVEDVIHQVLYAPKQLVVSGHVKIV
jgi:hypothetical protein